MSVIIFLVILVILILVHEFGHFIVAKKNGIRVDEFGIGFPPKILTLGRKNGTEYTLNWIPLGGFVKIFGENPNEESISGPDSERSFVNKPKIIQALVLVAGVVFNLIFAWFIFAVIFLIGVTTVVSDTDLKYSKNVEVVIMETLEGSPGAIAGILSDDRIISLDGNKIDPLNGIDKIVTYIVGGSGDIELVLMRADEEVNLRIMPELGLISGDPDRRAIGISMALIGDLKYPVHIALWEGGKITYQITKTVAVAIGALIVGAFTLSADLSDIAGPIGIVSVVGDAAELGIVSLLFFTAIISINLAVINILPIPALDGGRLLFLLIEVVKGSPLQPNVINSLHNIFFILLILLILLISYNDILRIIGG